MNEGLITGSRHRCRAARGIACLREYYHGWFPVRCAETVFAESRIARMTEGIQRSSVTESPIQKVGQYGYSIFRYVLVVVIAFAVVRGVMAHESSVKYRETRRGARKRYRGAGARVWHDASFAYGAAHLFRRHVLLQEVNATENSAESKISAWIRRGRCVKTVFTAERFLLRGARCRNRPCSNI